MTQRLRIVKRYIVIGLATVVLAGCASPVAQTIEISDPRPTPGGRLAVGVVASVRPVRISDDQIGPMAGVNAVLGALGQQFKEPPVTGEEFVIRKDDDNTAAVVEKEQTSSLAAGDRVALITSPTAIVIRRH